MRLVHRQISKSDLASIISLNNNAIPAVNALNKKDLTSLLKEASYHRIVLNDNKPVAFLIVFTPGANYQSPNYQWFSAHYADFAYIDRIVVAADYAKKSIGQQLYYELFDHFNSIPITCEVNLKPPNPASMRFHQKLGFKTVGTAQSAEHNKEYAYLVRETA